MLCLMVSKAVAISGTIVTTGYTISAHLLRHRQT